MMIFVVFAPKYVDIYGNLLFEAILMVVYKIRHFCQLKNADIFLILLENIAVGIY